MKHFFLTFIRSGTLFGLFMFLYFLAVYGPAWAAVVGAATASILFGLTMAAVSGYHARNFRLHPPDLGIELLLKDGPANHFFKGSSVGGWIYLTKSRLIFKSHWMNVHKHRFEVPLREISEAEVSTSFLSLKNKLHLHYRNGRIETFVVDDASEWKRLVESGSTVPLPLEAGKIGS